MSAALCALVLCAAAGENRLWLAELELAGPLERVEVAVDGGTTVLAGPLLAGERRTLLVPVPALAAPALGPAELWPEPGVRADGDGTAAFVRWRESEPDAFWSGVPRGLQARPRPPLAGARPRASVAALCTCAAALVLALGARRRAALAALGAGAALAAALLPAAGGDAPPIAVLEADLAGGAWVRVLAARDALALPADLGAAGESVRLESEPEGGALVFEASLAAGAPRWSVRAPGALLHLLERRAPDPDARPGRNPFGELAEAWVRDAAGTWSALGRWPRGTPRPAPGAAGRGTPAPPGWLAAGLPQGVGVLVGRLAEPGRAAWVRASGF